MNLPNLKDNLKIEEGIFDEKTLTWAKQRAAEFPFRQFELAEDIYLNSPVCRNVGLCNWASSYEMPPELKKWVKNKREEVISSQKFYISNFRKGICNPRIIKMSGDPEIYLMQEEEQLRQFENMQDYEFLSWYSAVK